MSLSQVKTTALPAMPCALAFVPNLSSKAVRLKLKIDPPSETPDP